MQRGRSSQPGRGGPGPHPRRVATLGKQIEKVSDECTTSVGQDVLNAIRSEMSDERCGMVGGEMGCPALETRRDLFRGLDIRANNGRGADRVEVH